MRKVEVVPHNPEWQNLFQVENKAIAKIIGVNVIAIHHIGSTSIPGIYAKSIIDLLVEVKDIDAVDNKNILMETLGYEAMGEFGIRDRHYFSRENSLGIRTHHVHEE